MAGHRYELFPADDEEGLYCVKGPRGIRIDSPCVEAISSAAAIGWLWQDRVPLGRVTLIEGPEGSGKSLVALDLAARCTAGLAWPDAPQQPQPACAALILCRQDHPADTIGARFERAGGDSRRLFEFSEFSTFEPDFNFRSRREIAFPFDLLPLDQMLEAAPALRLVVIDPLSDYCGGAGLFAETMLALNAIAAERDVAILVTLRAECRFSPEGRMQVKSRWPTDGARCVWGVGEDPEDRSRRLFMPVRMNACNLAEGLTFHVREGRVVWETTAPGEPAPTTGEIAQIDAWLLALLAEGELAASAIFRQGAECGYSPTMLRAARKRRKVGLRRIGYGPKGCWGWAIGGATKNGKTKERRKSNKEGRGSRKGSREPQSGGTENGWAGAETSESMAQDVIYEEIPQNRDAAGAHL
jgi:hypothetical protein